MSSAFLLQYIVKGDTIVSIRTREGLLRLRQDYNNVGQTTGKPEHVWLFPGQSRVGILTCYSLWQQCNCRWAVPIWPIGKFDWLSMVAPESTCAVYAVWKCLSSPDCCPDCWRSTGRALSFFSAKVRLFYECHNELYHWIMYLCIG